jgi:hypothetical protein
MKFITGLLTSIQKGWPAVKVFILSQLRGEFLKFALKKILGSAYMGGLRGWLVKLITVELYELIAEPVVKAVLRKGKYSYDRKDGKIIISEMDDAERRGDEDVYDDLATGAFE